MAGQTVAERNHDLPVLARVRVRDCRDLGRRDRPPRIG